MASAASAVVGAALPPARVQALAASLWPPRVLELQRVVVLMMPRALARVLVVALTPRALAQRLVVVLEPPRVLAFVPRALVLQQGPYLSAVLVPVLGSTGWLRTTTDRLLAAPSSSRVPHRRIKQAHARRSWASVQ